MFTASKLTADEVLMVAASVGKDIYMWNDATKVTGYRRIFSGRKIKGHRYTIGLIMHFTFTSCVEEHQQLCS